MRVLGLGLETCEYWAEVGWMKGLREDDRLIVSADASGKLTLLAEGPPRPSLAVRICCTIARLSLHISDLRLADLMVTRITHACSHHFKTVI